MIFLIGAKIYYDIRRLIRYISNLPDDENQSIDEYIKCNNIKCLPSKL